MAKKTTVKKPKRRLKKTVRRSIATVLMMTAVVVAAIPVPENLAVNPGAKADSDPMVSPVAYEEGTLTGSTNNPYVLPKPESEYKNPDGSADDAGLAADRAKAEANIMADITNPSKLVPTEIVTSYGGNLYLTWQFLYTPTGNKTGKLLKYNDEFPVDLVNLGLQPNSSYFIVHQNAFKLYFNNPDYLNTNQGPNGEPKETIRLSGMDNLSASGTFYPTNKIRYTYRDVSKTTGEVTLDEDTIHFFETYFGGDYNTYTNEFKKYWEEYNKLEKDGQKDAADALTKPAALERAASDITDETDRKKYFCEHNRTLSRLPNYSLELASDRRLTAGVDSDSVYVAHGDGSVPADSEYKDVNGYLVELDDTLITTIAYRAFADVHNVANIQIDQYVRTIERSAFQGADIASVDIGNATTIGDRAFYGCKTLKEVTFTDSSPTATIGVEAFYGSGINTNLKLPKHISSIGHGAFAYCLDLSEVQFFETGDSCTIGNFAFYGDTRLSAVNFARTVFQKIGKCAFAIPAPSGDTMTDFHFPSEGLEAMDDYVLANRRGLQNVYIENFTRKVPVNTFYNCFGLKKVEFSDKCGSASFDSELFKDVAEDDFRVYGPELYAGQPAGPRTSTWEAVRTDGKGVPYVYEKNGQKYYEMALESDDGTKYRYAANEDGSLISCALITKNVGMVDLVIPEKIGDIQIKDIGTGCFEDAELRAVIRSITIKNNSISTIGDSVFRGLKKLKKVRIGDSVTNIGANAFADCPALYDVYFTTPAAGHSALSIGDSAFVTTGDHLTFHGDIVEGYAPFVYAMDSDHVLRDPDRPSFPGVNICYQSLWDSEQGTRLTVMPDQNTDEVTLLDYPKFKDLENIAGDDELQDYCADMEEYYYYTVYNTDSEAVETMRREYAIIHDTWRMADPSVTLPSGETIALADMEDAMELRYGPWINPTYCDEGWKTYLSNGGETAKASAVDFLFKPMIVEAATDPIPYFDKYPYNFMDNYQNYLTMDTAAYNALPEYKKVPQKVWDFINGTQDIYVPAGVDSIDVISYMKQNSDNYNKYIKDRPADTMYTSTLGGAKPGLFSGYYKDYEDEDDDRETDVRGNDTIKSVVLTSVKEIPELAFDSCEQLSRVEMPAAEKVGKLPFRGCVNLVDLVGSAAYPAERGILYEKHKDADGNDRYRIIECLLARGRSNSGNVELTVNTVSSATDSLLPFLCEVCETDTIGDGVTPLPAIAEGAFEGCNDILSVNLSDAQWLKTISKNAFKDCNGISQMVLPGSVNKIADDAFLRTDPENAALMNVTIYGREVDIADSAFMPRDKFIIYSYEDSASKRYADRHGIRFEPLDAFRVWFYDYDGTPLGDSITVDKGYRFTEETIPAAAKVVYEKNHRPGYNFDKWMSDNGKTTDDPIENDMTVFVAQYTSDGTLVDGKCSVQFVHGRTGQALTGYGMDESGRYMIVPGTKFSDPLNNTSDGKTLQPPAAVPNPTEDGYIFLNEFRTDAGEVWTPETIISRNMTVLALFGQNGSNGNTSGGSTSNGSTSNGSTSGGSTTSRGSSSSSKKSSSTSSSSTSSSSTSTTSTTSSGVGQYTVFVEGGSGSGSYAPGTVVIISCYMPADGMKFEKWTTGSNGVALASTTMTTTTFTMPANNVTVKANYVEAPTAPTVAVNTGGGGGGGGGNGNTGNSGNTTSGNGNTQVDIEKPGISNRDLATANTNGSSDNFIVKISETDEATRAVAAALTNKYGTLDNILYYAMDISLYDSTGTTKITDTTGLSVDITIPIPDSLVAYGGNNMAGAVINGDQLESLNESFTTINGVPCIRFRATHFSPYTVYVDTGNLVEGMLDVTPKTGDPIHPKWFLSLGLACLSIILFLKKDKRVKAKA